MLSYAVLPAVLMIAGALVAIFRPPGPHLRSGILHFAAGLIFAVVAVELIPEMVKAHSATEVSIGFVLGVLAMLGLSRLTEGQVEGTLVATEESNAAASAAGVPLPLGMLLAVAVDLAIDGLLIGIGFAAGAKTGQLLAFALTVELLSLGLALATTLGQRGVSRGRVIGIIAGHAGVFLVVALVGATLLQGLPEAPLVIILSFGSAALLFLVTEELLVDAHEEKHTSLLTATFFAGFLLFLVLGIIG
ncbi:MAG: transporter [Chloroflexota bacterium]|nr:transporter [Chloroflexota bacterium]